MDQEVFVQADGELVSAWDIQFTDVQQQRKTEPCTYHERDGTVRKGVVHFTLESAAVTFSAPTSSVRVGQQGLMSATEDRFYDVTVSTVEPEQDHIRVAGNATRKFAYEQDR
jgi:hypothetical protein